MGRGRGAGVGGQAEMGQPEPVCFGHLIEASGRLEPLFTATGLSSEVGAATLLRARPSPTRKIRNPL